MKAYVETTVLTDALLKPGARARAATAAIRSYEESLLPVYAIREFKAGPLRRYVWFHGKLLTTRSWTKTLEQLRRIAGTPNFRFATTAVEALEAAAKNTRRVTMGSLSNRYGPAATLDVVLCDQYRYALGRIIRRGWKRRRTITSAVVDELSCYSEGDVSEERGIFELGETRCQPSGECSLANRLKAASGILEVLRDTIERQPTKLENLKRAKVLRELIRVPRNKLTRQECVQLGDAIFAFFCPKDAVILTTNLRDIRPLAEAVGKQAQSPTEAV